MRWVLISTQAPSGLVLSAHDDDDDDEHGLQLGQLGLGPPQAERLLIMGADPLHHIMEHVRFVLSFLQQAGMFPRKISLLKKIIEA
ncbi:g6493 [Coccomyxa elongata]